jgi:glyoxylase-like metal-dependent hydrolase (beta-lactamase superfamily II)
MSTRTICLVLEFWRRNGAELVLPRQNRVRPHNPVNEGDTLSLGAVSIAVLSTPGHTDESSTYLIPDIGIFTGDTLFLAGIGRPDLHAGGEEVETRARRLFASLKRLTSLDARLLVFPGHTSEPALSTGQC